jgi:hypothetical protein
MSKYACIPGMKVTKSPAPTPVRVAITPTLISVGVMPGPDCPVAVLDGALFDGAVLDGAVLDGEVLGVVPEQAAAMNTTASTAAAVTPL